MIVLLAFSANHESPTMPGRTEWAACDRPLGTWNALWLVKTVLSALLSVWNWQRGREANRTCVLLWYMLLSSVAHDTEMQTSIKKSSQACYKKFR